MEIRYSLSYTKIIIHLVVYLPLTSRPLAGSVQLRITVPKTPLPPTDLPTVFERPGLAVGSVAFAAERWACHGDKWSLLNVRRG